MKLKISMENIANLREGLEGLKDRKPNIALSYKIAKNIYQVNEAFKIYQAIEQDILSEYLNEEETRKLSDEDREAGKIVVNNAKDYSIKIAELADTKHELDVEVITLEELEENLGDLTPDTLFKLMPIIEA